MDKITFGKFIRENRKKAGLTQTELAAALMVNPNSIGNIERGQTYPDAEKLFRLIVLLDLSIDALMFAESRLEASHLPPELNEGLDALSAEHRGIVLETMKTLIAQLRQKEAAAACTPKCGDES